MIVHMKKAGHREVSNSLEVRRLIIGKAVLEGKVPESPSRPLCTSHI